MAMSPEVQSEYDAALLAVTLKHGTVVDLRPAIYGWEDHEASRHMADCTWVAPAGTRAVEDTWYEFAGSFAENDDRHTGLTAKGVSCRCGALTGRRVRWDAAMQEVAEAVFEEALGARRKS